MVSSELLFIWHLNMHWCYVDQGKAEEENKVENVTPGENQGLEVVVDRRSDRQKYISNMFMNNVSLTVLEQ